MKLPKVSTLIQATLITALSLTMMACVDESNQNYSRSGGINTAQVGNTNAIFGGEEVLEKDPWYTAMVSIENPQDDTNNCTGTLIHKRIVLTAAHCVWDLEEFRDQSVIQFLTTEAGAIYERGTMPYLGRVKHVEIPQPYFDLREENPMSTQFLYYDVALLLLEEDAPEGTSILPVTNVNLSFQQMPKFWSIGFGAQDAVIDVVDDVRIPRPLNAGLLRKAELDRNPNPESDFWLQSTQEKAGTCYGDSGAPALAEINGTWTIVGLSSFIKSLPDGPCRKQGHFVNLGYKVQDSVSWSEWIQTQVARLTRTP